MKLKLKFTAVFAVLLILSNSLSASTVKADYLTAEPSKKISAEDESANPEAAATESETADSDSEEILTEYRDINPKEILEKEENTSSKESLEEDIGSEELLSEEEIIQPAETEFSDIPIPDEKPVFHAKIEYSPSGYRVKGTFSEFPADVSLIQILYSLDGETYQVCEDNDWDLSFLGTEDPAELKLLQNHTCLYFSDEPLISYLEEKLDCFYLKLRLTKQNGAAYESQPAVICRNPQQPVPEGNTPYADFPSAMKVYERRPNRSYGKYQLTIREDATPEEISAFLPDTLPIQIVITSEDLFSSAFGTIDCPVKWKPLTLPPLAAGESITIPDAAEEIVISAGTSVKTPMGTFQLKEPLAIDHGSATDEIRLVLNVIAEDETPTGALSRGNNGLDMVFHLKPTGATAIRAYTLSEGESEWTEVPGLSFQQAVNIQPSTANSGYTLVLNNSSEPYRSYLKAEAAGKEPTPFLIGLTIEGGAYGGRQLILPFPAAYQCPSSIPKLLGSGGNEGNAGTDNKGDSTQEGQRPYLPQDPEDKSETTQPDTSPDPDHHPGDTQPEDSKVPDPDHQTENTPPGEESDPSQNQNYPPENMQPESPQIPEDIQPDHQPENPQAPENIQPDQKPETPQEPSSQNIFVQKAPAEIPTPGSSGISALFMTPQTAGDGTSDPKGQTAFSHRNTVTDIQAKITIPEILPQKEPSSASLISSGTKENAHRHTRGLNFKSFLILTAAMAGLSIAFTCISAFAKRRR